MCIRDSTRVMNPLGDFRSSFAFVPVYASILIVALPLAPFTACSLFCGHVHMYQFLLYHTSRKKGIVFCGIVRFTQKIITGSVFLDEFV